MEIAVGLLNIPPKMASHLRMKMQLKVLQAKHLTLSMEMTTFCTGVALNMPRQ